MTETYDFATYCIRLEVLFHFYFWPILEGRWRYRFKFSIRTHKFDRENLKAFLHPAPLGKRKFR
jgi:hypothetical protein